MKFAMLCGAALCAIATPAFAQTLGSSDSGNCYPFTCNDVGSIDYYELYNATSFPGVTTISSLTFKPWPVYPGTILAGNYTITLGTTSAAIGSNPVGSIVNEFAFYNGSLAPTQFTVSGTGYSYDPSLGNLFMHVVTTGQTLSPNPGAGYLFADYTGTQVSRSYTRSDNTTFSGTGALVTTFNAISVVPEPATWALMIMGFGAVGAGLRTAKRRSDRKFDAKIKDITAGALG